MIFKISIFSLFIKLQLHKASGWSWKSGLQLVHIQYTHLQCLIERLRTIHCTARIAIKIVCVKQRNEKSLNTFQMNDTSFYALYEFKIVVKIVNNKADILYFLQKCFTSLIRALNTDYLQIFIRYKNKSFSNFLKLKILIRNMKKTFLLCKAE